jgi:juvenile hormone acid methyltransferase
MESDTAELGYARIQPRYLDDYTKYAKPQFQWALEFLNRIDLKRLAKVVNLGCRDGAIALKIAQKNPGTHVIGLDSSITFLELANEMLAKNPTPNLEFRLMSPTHMDFHGTLDAIISFSLFHWISDKLAALEAIYRSLRPGGKVFLNFFADHLKPRFDQCIDTIAKHAKWSPYFVDTPILIETIQMPEFATMVHNAGFIIERLEFVEVHDVFQSKEELMEWLPTWVLCVQALPEEEQNIFLSEVVDKYLETHPADSKGRIHRIDYLLELDATKPL